jgi:hypothetical protein
MLFSGEEPSSNEVILSMMDVYQLSLQVSYYFSVQQSL